MDGGLFGDFEFVWEDKVLRVRAWGDLLLALEIGEGEDFGIRTGDDIFALPILGLWEKRRSWMY